MRKLTMYLLAACLLAPALSFAQDADSAREKEAARDMGAVRAWRLGPEAVEEQCRSADPEGNESRKKALQAWLDKNARLISAVDERVAEVAPLVVPPSKKADAVGAVRGQVKAILLEAIFAGTPDQAAAFCKDEANPASPRWTNNGMPHVQNSLAALYDWKIRQGGK
jgi:hypothetical protein